MNKKTIDYYIKHESIKRKNIITNYEENIKIYDKYFTIICKLAYYYNNKTQLNYNSFILSFSTFEYSLSFDELNVIDNCLDILKNICMSKSICSCDICLYDSVYTIHVKYSFCFCHFCKIKLSKSKKHKHLF